MRRTSRGRHTRRVHRRGYTDGCTMVVYTVPTPGGGGYPTDINPLMGPIPGGGGGGYASAVANPWGRGRGLCVSRGQSLGAGEGGKRRPCRRRRRTLVASEAGRDLALARHVIGDGALRGSDELVEATLDVGAAYETHRRRPLRRNVNQV